MYFTAADLAPLIHRVLSVSRMRVLLPVKANICDIIYQKRGNVKWEKGKTFGKGRKERTAGALMPRIPLCVILSGGIFRSKAAKLPEVELLHSVAQSAKRSKSASHDTGDCPL